MGREEFIDAYVKKMNEECLYRHKERFIGWSKYDIDDHIVQDYDVEYCAKMDEMKVLCSVCKKNLEEFKKAIINEVPYTITKGDYERIISELQEIKDMLNELRK